MNHTRRGFIKTTIAATTAITSSRLSSYADHHGKKQSLEPRFQISLAQWSLHRSIRKGELKNIDFPKYTKEHFGILGVEYVNSFFKDEVKST